MSGDREAPLVSILLLPVRVILFLGELATLLWLMIMGGGILALFAIFLWLLLTGGPR